MYACTVYVAVRLCYREGAVIPGGTASAPLYGQLESDFVRGRAVAELWPYDFAINTRATTDVRPLRLWCPAFSGATTNAFGIGGLERVKLAGTWRWVAQRWYCEPTTYAGVVESIRLDRQHGIRPRFNPWGETRL